MSLFSTLKRNARASLKGNWGKAILILLLAVGVSMILSALQTSATNLLIPPVDAAYLDGPVDEYIFQMLLNVTGIEIVIIVVFTALSVLLQSPLALGMTYWYQALSRGKPAPISEVFRCFESLERYGRAVWLEVNLGIRSLLWGLLFFTAPAVLYGISLQALIAADEAGQSDVVATSTVGLLIAAILFLLAALFYTVVINRYFLAAYLLNEDDRISVRKAIRVSVAYSKGYRFSLLWFQLSFILWFLLSGLLLLFPMLYVSPYFAASSAQYARFIIEKNRADYPTQDTQEFALDDD